LDVTIIILIDESELNKRGVCIFLIPSRYTFKLQSYLCNFLPQILSHMPDVKRMVDVWFIFFCKQQQITIRNKYQYAKILNKITLDCPVTIYDKVGH